MNSNLFRLNINDLLHGALNAVVAAVICGLYGIVSKEGFDVFHVDWAALLPQVINWAFIAFVGSLGGKFVTNPEGKVFGKIPTRIRA